MSNLKTKTILFFILIFGFYLRVHGLNWDQGNHLHPDERFLTMVANVIKIPPTISSYLDTKTSLANPHNVGNAFYVYGTFPVHIVKIIASKIGLDDYTHLTLLGRFTSALLDTSIILLVFAITQRIASSSKAALIAAFTYSCTVLSIQLSHFYAVDTFMVFFLVLSIGLLLSQNIKSSLASGIFFGLSLSSKISAAIFLPIFALILFLWWKKSRTFSSVLISGIFFSLALIVTTRLAYPYLFVGGVIPTGINDQVLSNWKELKSFEHAGIWFPPAVQWLSAQKIVYPFENLMLWGLGLPLGLLGIFSLVLSIPKTKKHPLILIPISLVLLNFFYQGLQSAMPIRYFYPLCPFLAVLVGVTMFRLSNKKIIFLSGLFLIWPIAFSSIYARPHSRVAATSWMISHIPPGSRITCEHWDDCLPLGNPYNFVWIELPLYNPDSPQKTQEISNKLSQVDFVVLSSNRLYGSILGASKYYPQTSRFYTQLFNGSLGFSKVAEFTSRPNLPIPGLHLCLTPPGIRYGKIARASQDCPLPGISFVDDYADEVFTVYDHPKVLIFKKNQLD